MLTFSMLSICFLERGGEKGSREQRVIEPFEN